MYVRCNLYLGKYYVSNRVFKVMLAGMVGWCIYLTLRIFDIARKLIGKVVTVVEWLPTDLYIICHPSKCKFGNSFGGF